MWAKKSNLWDDRFLLTGEIFWFLLINYWVRKNDGRAKNIFVNHILTSFFVSIKHKSVSMSLHTWSTYLERQNALWAAESLRDQIELVAEELGSKIEAIEALQTPISHSIRHCIYLRKYSSTPSKFPRPVGVPNQKPL